MAHNQMANAYLLKREFDKAVSFGKSTIDARPDHALGYVMLACTFCLSSEFRRCLEQLSIINKKQTAIETYAFFCDYSIENDSDFELIKADRECGPEFNNLVNSINKKRDKYERQKSA